MITPLAARVHIGNPREHMGFPREQMGGPMRDQMGDAREQMMAPREQQLMPLGVDPGLLESLSVRSFGMRSKRHCHVDCTSSGLD